MATNEQFDMELKETLIAMMQWFHQFCIDNDIRYYVVDGTMLGAARHQGFIPWDDDIDVGVPRRDYEKLASILNEKTEGRYVLETPDSPAKEFIYTYSKLYDTTTTLVEHARKDIRRGVFIDIFPLLIIPYLDERNFIFLLFLISLFSNFIFSIFSFSLSSSSWFDFECIKISIYLLVNLTYFLNLFS